MPTSLKQAFKYPLLSKTIVTSDSGSIRNEFFRPDNNQNFYLPKKTKNIVEYQDKIEPETGSVLQSEMNAHITGDVSEYELLDKVLKNPKCMNLLRVILLGNQGPSQSQGNIFNFSLSTDDILKYGIFFIISIIIYKKLF